MCALKSLVSTRQRRQRRRRRKLPPRPAEPNKHSVPSIRRSQQHQHPPTHTHKTSTSIALTHNFGRMCSSARPRRTIWRRERESAQERETHSKSAPNDGATRARASRSPTHYQHIQTLLNTNASVNGTYIYVFPFRSRMPTATRNDNVYTLGVATTPACGATHTQPTSCAIVCLSVCTGEGVRTRGVAKPTSPHTLAHGGGVGIGVGVVVVVVVWCAKPPCAPWTRGGLHKLVHPKCTNSVTHKTTKKIRGEQSS